MAKQPRASFPDAKEPETWAAFERAVDVVVKSGRSTVFKKETRLRLNGLNLFLVKTIHACPHFAQPSG
jgi:hypothetical protein